MRINTLLILFLAALPQLSWATVPPPTLKVDAYLLKDFNSKSDIASYQANKHVEPASLTKIMTAYISFDAIRTGKLKLAQVVPVSKKAWQAEGSRMFIEPNKPVTVNELLHGLIIQSGNDAAIALAEAIAGSEEQFATMMNEQAQKLGMSDTNYNNATGLPSKNHYTTANDLAILARALIDDFPNEYHRLYSVKEYTYNKIKQLNRNRLLWLDAHVDGMKTGYTKAAGYCLIATAKRKGTRLISIILGAPSNTMRAAESQRLLNYGFQFYRSTLVYKKSQPVSDIPVYKGQQKTVKTTMGKDFYLLLPKGEYAKVKAKMISKQPLIAPVKIGAEVGKITFSLDGKVIKEEKLFALKTVNQANFFGRIADSIRLLLK